MSEIKGLTFAERVADTTLYGKRNILSTFDLAPNAPDVAAQFIKKHSDQFRNTIGLDLTMMGREVPIDSEEHVAFTEGRYWNTAKVHETSAQVAVNTPQEIKISVQQTSTTAFFPKKGHTIMFPGIAQKHGLVASVNIDNIGSGYVTITVVPANGEELQTVEGNDELVISSSAWGEGTGQPGPTTRTFGQEKYYLQILKDQFGITGSQMTSKLEFDISEDGKYLGIYNMGVADLDAKMLRMEENALLFESGLAYDHASLVAAGLVESANNNFVQTTRGVLPWIKERGKTDELAVTSWDTTVFDDIDDYLKSEGDTSHIVCGYLGKLVARRLNSQLAALTNVVNSYDPTSALSQYLGGEGYDEVSVNARAVNLRFMEYANINRTWAFRELLSFSDTTGVAAHAKYKQPGYSFWFPLTNITDGKTGTVYPNVALMYKSKDGYSRRREMFVMKGADGDTANYNTETDHKRVNQRSHIGLMFHKPNLAYLTHPAD